MKNVLFTLLMFAAGTSIAAEPSFEVLQKYTEVSSEIYILDAKTGMLLGKESSYQNFRFKEGKIDTPMFVDVDGKRFGLNVSMKFEKHQALQAKVTQYKDLNWKSVPGGKTLEGNGILKEENFNLKMFEGISWNLHETESKRYVVRLTPTLKLDEIPEKVTSMQVAGKGISVYDNKGNLWTDSFGVEGKFAGLIIPRLGKYLVVSFYPFKGSQQGGYASGNKIIVQDGALKITMVSSQPFYSGYRPAEIYFKIGEINTDKKTSAITMAFEKEPDNIEAHMKKLLSL